MLIKMNDSITQHDYDIAKGKMRVSTNPYENPAAAYSMMDFLACVYLKWIIVPDDLKW